MIEAMGQHQLEYKRLVCTDCDAVFDRSQLPPQMMLSSGCILRVHCSHLLFLQQRTMSMIRIYSVYVVSGDNTHVVPHSGHAVLHFAEVKWFEGQLAAVYSAKGYLLHSNSYCLA